MSESPFLSRLSMFVFPLDRPQWLQKLPVEAKLATGWEEPFPSAWCPPTVPCAHTLGREHTAHSGSQTCAKSDLANGERESEAGEVVFTFPQQT